MSNLDTIVDLDTLKDEIMEYVNKSNDHIHLLRLSNDIKSKQRQNRVDKINSEISKITDCSEYTAEFVADHYEEIYKIISKIITYEGVKVSPEKEIR